MKRFEPNQHFGYVLNLENRIAELEAELSFSEKQVQNSLVLIAEKDKRIAELEIQAKVSTEYPPESP